MNSISAEVQSITSSGKVYVVSLESNNLTFSVLALDSSNLNVTPGTRFSLLFKETEVSIGTRSDLSISLRNRIPGTVISAEKGELLCRVTLASPVGEIHSIITRASADELQLESGKEAVAYIKSTDIMLAKE